MSETSLPSSQGPRLNHPTLLLVAVVVATVMYAMDATIANIILPHLQGSLQASQDQISWVLTSYIVVSVIVTPLLSPLAQRFSSARVLMFSIVGFTFASLLCGMAQTLPQMVIFRMLQGASGAALMPISQAILMSAFPRERHASVLAVWGVGVMIGPIIGPTVGGYLTEVLNWRYVFLVNLPIGLLALAGIAATVPREKARDIRRFDLAGYLMMAIFIGAFQLMLDRGNVKDWFDSREILAEALVALVFFYMFVVHSATTPHPFYSPALFRDRNFLLGCSLICVMVVAVFSTMALLPVFLQQLRGYPVLDAGMLLAPRGVAMAATSLLFGKVLYRLDHRYIIVCGLCLIAWSSYWMSLFSLDVPSVDIWLTGVLQGAGLGLAIAPLMSATFATLHHSLRTEGAVLFAVMRNVGSAIGISITFTMLTRSTHANQARLVEHVSVLDFEKWAVLRSTFGSRAEAILAEEISKQASLLAYVNDFRLLFVIALLGIPLALLMRREGHHDSRKKTDVDVKLAPV